MTAEAMIEEFKHLPVHEQAEVARFIKGSEASRLWTPEELGAAADAMVQERDPVKAQKLWDEIVVGFYGGEPPDA